MPNILRNNPALDLSPFAVGELNYAEMRGIYTEDGHVIQAQVVVSEDHTDDLIITDHPIQAGAFINDHAFKKPAEVSLQMGWSNAYTFDQMFGTAIDIYRQILELQSSRLPFIVVTGKRMYYNMLVASLRTHTDQRLEYSFMADISFREVVLVNTSVVSAGQIYDQTALRFPELLPNLTTGTIQTLPAMVPDDYIVASGIVEDYGTAPF